MPKRRERSETEWLKSQNKELRKENRLLKRRLKELERNQHMYDQFGLGDPEEEPVQEIAPTLMADCEECGKGHMNLTIDLGFKKIYDCPVCGHRKAKHG